MGLLISSGCSAGYYCFYFEPPLPPNFIFLPAFSLRFGLILTTPYFSYFSSSTSGSFKASYIFLVSFCFLPIPKLGTLETPLYSYSVSVITGYYFFYAFPYLRLNFPVKGDGLIFKKLKVTTYSISMLNIYHK